MSEPEFAEFDIGNWKQNKDAENIPNNANKYTYEEMAFI